MKTHKDTCFCRVSLLSFITPGSLLPSEPLKYLLLHQCYNYLPCIRLLFYEAANCLYFVKALTQSLLQSIEEEYVCMFVLLLHFISQLIYLWEEDLRECEKRDTVCESFDRKSSIC